eukprot:Gb_32758 [translate_table: standard]
MHHFSNVEFWPVFLHPVASHWIQNHHLSLQPSSEIHFPYVHDRKQLPFQLLL